MKIQLRKTSTKFSRKNRAAGIRRNILATSAVALIGFCLAPQAAHAAVDNWTGATNASWDTVTNWSLAAKPTAADSANFLAVIPGTGATITLTAGEVANNVTFANAYTLTGGDLTLNAGAGAVDVSGAFVATINSTLINAGSLSKTGTGTLVLGATDTYTGATAVNAGTLQVNGTIANSAVTVNAGGTLTGTGFISQAATLAGGTITLGNTGTFSGNLTVTGGGNWTGNGSVSGSVLLNTGTLTVGAGANLTITGAGLAVATAGTLAGTGTVTGNATLTGNGIINFGAGGNITGTLGVTGGNWNGAGTVTGLVTSSSGNFNIGNGANLTATAGLSVTGGTFSNGNAASTLTGSLNYTSTGNSNFGGVIAGAASTVTVNTGTLTTANFLRLTGNNTYGGLTTVTSGSLDVGNANGLGGIGSGTTVATGATLGIDGGVNVGAEALSIAGTGVTAGGVGVGALQGGTFGGGLSGYAGAITLTGNATIGTNSIATTFNLTGGINTAGNTLTLGTTVGLAGNIINVSTAAISGAGGIAVDTGITNLNFSNTYTGATAINNGGTLNATVAGALSAPVADGGTGTVRSAVTLDNAVAASNLNLIGGFNQAVASLTGGGNSLVNLNGNTLTIGNSLGGAAATMSGVISGGGGGLIKDGTSTQVLAAANTYTGVTTINAGILNIQNATALGTIAAGTTVAGGATLQIQGGITVGAEALTLNGTGAALQNGALVNIAGTNNYGGLVTLGSASTISSDAGVLNLTNPGTIVGGGFGLTVTGAGNGSITSIIAPTVASLTKNGAGTWTLNGVNTYTGTTTVNAGTLQAGVATSAFGIGSAVTVNAAKLDLNGFSNTVGSLAGSGASSLDNTSATAVTLTTGSAGSTIFAGIIQNTGGGALSLTKVGAGTTLSLGGGNTYTGLTTVSQGTLVVTNNNSLGAATGAATDGTVVSNGATLQINGGSTTIGNEALTINGTGVGGIGALANGAGANSYGGVITLGSNSTISSNVGTLTLANAGAMVGGGFGLTLAGAGNGNVTSIIGATVASLTKNGAGTWTLTGANAYAGTTSINAGILNIQNATALGTTAGGTVVAGGATLQLQGGITVGSEALTLNGAGAAGTGGALAGNGGTNNFGGLLTLGSASTVSSDVVGGVLNLTNPGTIVGGGFGLTLAGVANGSITSIISPTVSSLTKNGGGIWTLNGVNTYTGTTTVNGGVLQAGVATSAFGIGSAVTVANIATLDLNGNSNAVGSLNGVAGSFVDNTSATVATITTGSLGTNDTFTGTIQNTGGATSLALTKVGVGSLTINGATANTYGGGTTLNDGSLIINKGLQANPNDALGTGTLTINAAQTPATFPTGVVLGSTVNGPTIPLSTHLANQVDVNASFTITTAGNLIFTGPVRLMNGVRTITGTTSQSQPTFSGVISNGPGVGAGGITFTTPTPGTAGFALPVGVINPYVAFLMDNNAAPNTYTGLTTVNNNAVLVFNGTTPNVNKVVGNIQIDGKGVVELLAASHQIADTATVTVNSPGSQIINALPGARFQGFDLNNFSETIATLNGNANGTVGLGAGTFIVSSGNYAGAIVPSTANGSTGTGIFQKNGAGTLTLTGTSSYTGTTRITAGTVAVGSAKALGNANLVVNGGTLQNSTLGAANTPLNVNIGPGSNITINGGTVAFIVGGKDGGVLLHDTITTTTTGAVTAAIGGTLALTQTNGYTLGVGDKVTLVSAAGGVAGGTANGTAVPGTNVTGLSAFTVTPLLVPTVNLYSTSIVLEALQGSFSALTASLNLSPNQQAVAAVLDQVAANNGRKTGVVAALDLITNDSIRFGTGIIPGDLDLLAPEELASVFTVGTALSGLQHANLQRHFEELRAEAGSAARGGFPGINSESAFGMRGPRGKGGKEIRPPRQMSGNERWGTFLMGSGNFTTVGSTSNASGYRLDTGGVTAGLEYKLAENFVVGIDAGYASTEARLVNGGKVDVDGGQFGIFASYFDMGFYVDAAVHGGVAGYKTRRTALGGVETASPGGSSFSALIAAGYDWKIGGLTVGPTLNFQYTNTRLNGFTENGGSLAPLTVQGHNGESTRTAVGARAFYDVNVGSVIVRPELRVGWQHEYSDTSHALTSNFATLGGNAFTVSGPQIGRDSLLVGAGVTVVVNSLLSTFVAYDGELARTNYSSHSVSGGVRIKF